MTPTPQEITELLVAWGNGEIRSYEQGRAFGTGETKHGASHPATAATNNIPDPQTTQRHRRHD